MTKSPYPYKKVDQLPKKLTTVTKVAAVAPTTKQAPIISRIASPSKGERKSRDTMMPIIVPTKGENENRVEEGSRGLEEVKA